MSCLPDICKAGKIAYNIPMTLHRAFVPASFLASAAPNILIELPEVVVHRLRNVLRLKADSTVELFDGQGLVVRGHLASANGSQFLVEAVERQILDAPKLALVQALVKQDKLEEIIQHGTELGIHQFVLFNAMHSIVKVTERTPHQMERLQRIATDAARQCERNDIPEFLGPLAFLDLISYLGKLKNPPASLILVGEPREKAHLFETLQNLDLSQIKDLMLVIGPEGGLDPAEIAALTQVGARLVRYAPHVLRTQTAGLVGMSIIQSFLR